MSFFTIVLTYNNFEIFLPSGKFGTELGTGIKRAFAENDSNGKSFAAAVKSGFLTNLDVSRLLASAIIGKYMFSYRRHCRTLMTSAKYQHPMQLGQ